jgi:hypothetical protein
MSQLRTCPRCSRHHRVCEPLCPFCGGALPPYSAASATSPRDRMSRAMLVASGAALLGALEMQRQGLRERLVRVEEAPGVPFDHGRFEIVVEEVRS